MCTSRLWSFLLLYFYIAVSFFFSIKTGPIHSLYGNTSSAAISELTETRDASQDEGYARRTREILAGGWPRIALCDRQKDLSPSPSSSPVGLGALRGLTRRFPCGGFIESARADEVRVADRAVVGPIPHAREPVSALIVRWSRHRSRDRTRSRLSLGVSLTQPCQTSPSRSHGPWHFVLLTCRRTRNPLRTRDRPIGVHSLANANRE